MAEFCLDCFNKMEKANLKKRHVVLSSEEDLCEGCGEYKKVVMRLRWCAPDIFHRSEGDEAK